MPDSRVGSSKWRTEFAPGEYEAWLDGHPDVVTCPRCGHDAWYWDMARGMCRRCRGWRDS